MSTHHVHESDLNILYIINVTEIQQRRQQKSKVVCVFDMCLEDLSLDRYTPGFVKKYKITLVYLPPNVHLHINLSGGLFMVFFRQKKDSHCWGIEKCSNRDRNIFDYLLPVSRYWTKKKILNSPVSPVIYSIHKPDDKYFIKVLCSATNYKYNVLLNTIMSWRA